MLPVLAGAGEGEGSAGDGAGAAVHVPDAITYPSLQVAQMAAPLVVQAEPVAAAPFAQVHVLAEHAEPTKVYPASQIPQLAAPWTEQDTPV